MKKLICILLGVSVLFVSAILLKRRNNKHAKNYNDKTLAGRWRIILYQKRA